jgi:hypothetical protein
MGRHASSRVAEWAIWSLAGVLLVAVLVRPGTATPAVVALAAGFVASIIAVRFASRREAQRTVFVSYSDEYKVGAERLVEQFRRSGAIVWARMLVPDVDVALTITHAHERSAPSTSAARSLAKSWDQVLRALATGSPRIFTPHLEKDLSALGLDVQELLAAHHLVLMVAGPSQEARLEAQFAKANRRHLVHVTARPADRMALGIDVDEVMRAPSDDEEAARIAQTVLKPRTAL